MAATGSCGVRASGACEGIIEVPMRIFTENEPLNGPGGDFPESCEDGRAMTSRCSTGSSPLSFEAQRL